MNITITRKSQCGFGNPDKIGELARKWDECKDPEESEQILMDICRSLGSSDKGQAFDQLLKHFVREWETAKAYRAPAGVALKYAKGPIVFVPNGAKPQTKPKKGKRKK